MKPATTDNIAPVADISPPLLENLGATLLPLMNNILPYSESLIMLGCMNLIALSPFGRRRWRTWMAAGVMFVIAGIIEDDNALVMRTAAGLRKDGGYASAGIWSIAVVGSVLAGAVVSVLRRGFRQQ